MPNIRDLTILLDRPSWAPNQPPAALLAAERATFDLDLDAALVFIGIWTRPPTRNGFSLSDCWAWLRYFPAFCSGRALRLCNGWSDIDPHQKTVASDDFGVGLTTWVLHRTLGFERFADTLWVMNVLAPGQYRFRRRARRGPAKSPDYIAEDATGGVSVVECKGTQSSIQELRKAIERGLPQKENVVPRGGDALIHSLVAGAFVPQWPSEERATVIIADPEWKEVTDELKKYTADEIRASTEQVAYAKELALFELAETAGSLVGDVAEPSPPGRALDRDLQTIATRGRLIGGEKVEVVRDHFWQVPIERDGQRLVGVRFRASLELDRLAPLRQPQAQQDSRATIYETTSGMGWKENRTAAGAHLTSPIGAEYDVEWLAE